MTNLSYNDELKKLAGSFALLSKTYSGVLSKLNYHTVSIEDATQAVKKQFDIERKLLESTDTKLEQINRAMDNAISSSIQSISVINLNLTRMAKQQLITESSFAKIFENQKCIIDMIKGIGIGDSLTAAFARIDTNRTLSASLVAQTKLANLEGLFIERIPRVESALNKAMKVNLEKMISSCRSLIEDAIMQDSHAEYLPLITTYPPIECSREISFLETFMVDNDSEGEVDDSIDIDKAIYSFPSIEGLLADLNPKLLRLLEGARKSLRGKNPDRTRHVLISYRELWREVLHALAPDEDIRQWTTDSKFYENNRPTRKARLFYICRHINSDPFECFVEDDVRAIMSNLEWLNKGTHVIESNLTTAQLSSMASRTESNLLFLLQISKF